MTSATIIRPVAVRGARSATRPALRRLLVTIGVAGSLLIAGVTVRAASQWAATQAPLAVAPVSVENLQAALDQERSRSTDLQRQLSALQSSTGQLSSALLEAQSRAGEDQSTAVQLRASLAAAQAKLSTLQASLASAAKQAARSRSTNTMVTTPPVGGGGEPNDN
jgi:septal ring factor EnvC (AmiA/AmiB activator)